MRARRQAGIKAGRQRFCLYLSSFLVNAYHDGRELLLFFGRLFVKDMWVYDGIFSGKYKRRSNKFNVF